MDLTLDPKTTALVLIDLQHSIVARQLTPHSAADVVARSAQLAEALRGAGGTVVYVHALIHEFVPREADRQMPARGELPANACDIVPEAGMQSSDLLIGKRQWGAFYGTSLDQQLRRRSVRTIVLGGIATNIGVESTARAAYDIGYRLVFAEDAMSTMAPEMQEFATQTIFPRMGYVRSTAQILAALQ